MDNLRSSYSKYIGNICAQRYYPFPGTINDKRHSFRRHFFVLDETI
jgi:hypothetical protein